MKWIGLSDTCKTMWKKDDRLPYQNIRFFISSKGVGLSLDI